MLVRPFIIFSCEEIKAIRASLEERLTHWVDSVFGKVPIEEFDISQAFTIKDDLIDLSNQYMGDDLTIAKVVDKSIVIKVITSSNQWLNWLRLTADLKHKSQAKNGLRREEIAILLNSIAIDLASAICPSHLGNHDGNDSLISCAKIKGHGVLFGKLKLEDFVVEFLIDGNLHKQSKKDNLHDKENSKPLEQRLVSCANLSVKLNAFLGSIDISIGDIEKINKGDVIKIEHFIYEPVLLATAAGHVVCKGNLGVKDGNKALSVIS